ncbi:helix-turn-helix transcriptional regulator [Candidatus Sulfurimonas baltica]|uniref:WYL domain-containing protein n=1 Tax=Candidatus Sulfurimonas baltica TaxID=2740404 RepID=A0A7S7LYL3_9BACT|nr:WYL domain-containing protein [Candidatus Sulfurimonas baltica]QOY53253.1 WYL domain-containing protein [Candidatus Sulfurimonas baltica]
MQENNDSSNDLKSHDTTVTRLILILSKLDEDERPTQKELAQEFSVSLRTIQRDIGRLCYFPIEKTDDGKLYFTEGFSLKRTSFEDIEMVLLSLSLSMIMDISPKFSKSSHSLLAKLLVPNFATPYLIKQNPYESIDVDSAKLNELEYGIENKRITTIMINKREFVVEPYKIISFDEIWYLFAKELESEKIKTFFISDISQVDYSQKSFTMKKPIDSILENVHTAWFDDGVQYEVKVKIMQPIAHYFKRKKHFVSQELVREDDDGSIVVSFKVSSDEEVDNLIKSWLPHIKVISPKRIRKKMLKELDEYVKSLKNFEMTHPDV